MASGARPSSSQRATVAVEVDNGSAIMASDRKRGGRHRHTADDLTATGGMSPPSTGLTNCVVCGDRACSHYYYGVAACHGCKCFFWRSVKQQVQYKCRYEGNCDITVNARNACRYCRFQRCIRAGMQPESVRVKKDDVPVKARKHAHVEPTPDLPGTDIMERPPPVKKQYSSVFTKMLELEAKVLEEADFNENNQNNTFDTLQDIFMFPEYMDAYRTRVTFCVRLRSVSEEDMNFCKFRTLAYALDYVRALDYVFPNSINVMDQIALLRHSYGSITVFNIAVGTASATRDNTLLCLPTGITVSKHEEVISNSFMSHIVIVGLIDSLVHPVDELRMTENEILLLRGIIVLNAEARGLSPTGKQWVAGMRDLLHTALYQECQSVDSTDAPVRFAKLLHLLPKIALLSRDLVEHIKVAHTFNADMRRVDPLFFELFGDIFQDEREHMAGVSPAASVRVKEQVSPGTYDQS
uniref:Nuclear receptor domain-containing protein n=1 Tax=Panagrellus redivivus TaxID=6233 RepID=A0A7E4VDP7_PANRE